MKLWGRRRLPALAIALLAMALVAGIFSPLVVPRAEAHAVLVKSSPENGAKERRAPLRVVLTFSEALEEKLTDIRVVDKDQKRVDKKDVAVDASDRTIASVAVEDLAPGLYTVQFDNVSAVDGHPWSGVYQFIILNLDGSTPPGVEFDPDAVHTGTTGQLPKNIDVALKWIAMLSLAAAAGAAFWVLAVARPAAGFLDDEPHHKAVDAAEWWLIVFAHVLLTAAFITAGFLVGLTVIRLETSVRLWDYLTSVRTGEYRLALELLTLAAIGSADVMIFAKRRLLRNAGLIGLLATTLGGLLTYSLISHGATGDGSFWSVTADYVHLVATAAWLGALVMLVPFLWWVRRELQSPERFLYLANVFDRFSLVAGLSVIAILATGTFNGLVEIPNPGAMIHTTYGRVLIAKLSLMMPLLAIAGVNAFYLKPRLVSTIDGLYQEGGANASEAVRASWEQRLASLRRVLPRTIAIEIALVAAVIASVALLTQTSTAKGELAQEQARKQAQVAYKQAQPAGDLQLDIEIRPNRVGNNQYTVFARTQDGKPPESVTEMRLRFTYPDPAAPGGIAGRGEIQLQSRGGGEYVNSGSLFTQPGSWTVETTVKRTGVDDVSRTFVVPVGPTEAAAKKSRGTFALPFTSLNWNQVVGGALVLAGAVVILYRREFAAIRAWANRAAVTSSAVLFVGGGVLLFGVHSHDAALDPSQGNPVKMSQQSIDRGKELFSQNCIVCHGENGDGKGPRAAELNPAPADLRAHMPFHTDPQFFSFIANGFPGTAMPAWKDQISTEDIWNLLNYLRSAFGQTSTQ